MPTPGVQDAQRNDPFVKVNAMIKHLIVQSMEQAYCDTELATNKATRENMQSGEEFAFLAEALGHLRQEQSEATKIRSEEKATNEQKVADAKVVQVAVERATQVLKDF